MYMLDCITSHKMALVFFPPQGKTTIEGENHSAKEREENEYAGPTCKVMLDCNTSHNQTEAG